MELDLNNIINAANYENLCDFSIIPPENKYFTEAIFNKNAIIFCKTDYIDYLFNNLVYSKKSYIIITHHSDYPIDPHRFYKKPNCIKKWFAINAALKHEDLICIPLGLKTHKGIYLEPRYMTDWFVSNMSRLRLNNKQDKVYCNWGDTNPERSDIILKLKKNNINITHESNISFDVYANHMSCHKFVLSPPGNGIDCHRTWESLYVGCIPIVIKNHIYDNFKNLPLLQVNDYSEVTSELLSSFHINDYSSEKLNMSFWSDIIKDSLCAT
jgi:hypothetical protein